MGLVAMDSHVRQCLYGRVCTNSLCPWQEELRSYWMLKPYLGLCP